LRSLQQPTITLEHVSVESIGAAGQRWVALQDVSYSFAKGTWVGMIGRNGAGKTTFARVLVGLDQPTQGRVLRQPGSVRVMHLLQRPEDQFTQTTVFFEIARFLYRSPDRREVRTLMMQLGLSLDYQHVSPRRLSSGEQRLVAIACVLAARPDFLILDEPMAGLDAEGRAMVRSALQRLATESSMAFLIISHHIDDLMGLVDSLLVIEDGAISYHGDFSKLPEPVLNRNIAPDDVSSYRFLRQLEFKGTAVPPSYYANCTLEQLRELLR